MPNPDKRGVSIATLSRAVLVITSPTVVVFIALVLTGSITANQFVVIYGTILAVTTLILRPFFANTGILTNYVKDLAEDRQVKEPNFGFLSGVSELTDALIRLHRSWEKRKMQMSNIITEREILLDSLPDILIMCNDNLTVIRTNKAARSLFGQNLASPAPRVSDMPAAASRFAQPPQLKPFRKPELPWTFANHAVRGGFENRHVLRER